MFKAIKELKPDYIAACFDVSKSTFRTKLFEDYKANREKAPDELYSQIPNKNIEVNYWWGGFRDLGRQAKLYAWTGLNWEEVGDLSYPKKDSQYFNLPENTSKIQISKSRYHDSGFGLEYIRLY